MNVSDHFILGFRLELIFFSQFTTTNTAMRLRLYKTVQAVNPETQPPDDRICFWRNSTTRCFAMLRGSCTSQRC